MDRTSFLVFVLLAMLIAFVYYVGAATDFTTLAQASRTVIYALTGRDASGQFASYPGGAALSGNVLQAK